MDNEDPEDIPFDNFVLPEKFLHQLFEFSGSTEGNRGILLAFVNQNGDPVIFSKSDNQIVEMGLRKAAEKYLIESEAAEHLNGNDPL